MKQTTTYISLLLVFIMYSTPGWAQQDTLATVHIRRAKKTQDGKTAFATGQQVQTIDSAIRAQYRQQTVSNLLSDRLPVFVKSYSFNGLATVSFRGASSAQSAVYWNGIPIQNAALGVADLSTLPVAFADKVEVVYGGSGALYGSGNAGGALLLTTARTAGDTIRERWSAAIGAGSFGQYSSSLKGALNRNKWHLSARAFWQHARNNYSYNPGNATTQKMTNGSLNGTSALLQGGYNLGKKSSLDAAIWYQAYDRQIPPALFEAASHKEQQDNSLKSYIGWNYTRAKSEYYAKASLIRDNITYTDPDVRLHTSNTVWQYYQEAGWRYHIPRLGNLLVFAPAQISWIPSSLTDTQRISRYGLAATWTFSPLKHLSVAVQSRAEIINGKHIFLPGAGSTYQLTNWLKLRANVQRSYRLPTLNELYYFPGGNTALKPEHGWSEDAGYTLHLQKSAWQFHHDASLFNRNMYDWIVWLGGAIWTPHNIAQVHSRGTETETSLKYTTGDWQYSIGVNTAYVLSTTTSSYIPADGSVGKQIPYTPRYNGRIIASVQYKRVLWQYTHTYTGYRFITADESSWLAPYQTGNVLLSYTYSWRTHAFAIQAQCRNIWNESYSVAGFRPMPGRNWLAGCSIDF